MLAVDKAVAAHDWGALPKPVISLRGQPTDESHPTLLWDGEWEITYVTFRDMGAAFGVAMLGIYVLVVAQFRSFKLPLVILTPIPLTLIGIVLGHWLFHAPFTATSMIGFIALAGIIVRNSILLVDFVRHGARAGHGAARGAAGRRCDPLQADPADRAVGDDRRGDDPERSDLPGVGDLAAVRAGIIDIADGAGDPGDLCGAARRRWTVILAREAGEVETRSVEGEGATATHRCLPPDHRTLGASHLDLSRCAGEVAPLPHPQHHPVMSLAIRVSRLPHGEGLPLPSYATAGSAGMDLLAAVTAPITVEPGTRALIPTGLTIALPPGYELQIRPRSGLALRNGILLPNSPGTIDEDYRGELQVILLNAGDAPFTIERGTRIAQAVLAPVVRARWHEVTSLDGTARGTGGFGSTGTG